MAQKLRINLKNPITHKLRIAQHKFIEHQSHKNEKSPLCKFIGIINEKNY